MIEKNVKTDFSAKVSEPVIGSGTFVHPLAAVIGNVILGNNVMVAPTACVRGDEGQPLHVGDDTNVQDGVVIHALETELDGQAGGKESGRSQRKEIRGLCGEPCIVGPSGADSRAGCGYG